MGIGEQRISYGTRSITVPLLPNTQFLCETVFFRSMIPSNATPATAIIDHVEGSGTDATASPLGLVSPVMKLALIAAPVVASYSPTVVPWKFDTKRLLPDTASVAG